MISQPATPARLGAAPRPGTRLVALLAGLGPLVLGLMVLAFAVLAPAPAERAGSAFRPALAVMAPHAAPVQALLMHRLDRDLTAVTAADIELPADPALPSPSPMTVQVPGFVATAYREARAARPSPAAPASPLRPPRAG